MDVDLIGNNDPLGNYWDIENCAMFNAELFLESLEAELESAYPGRRREIHAFGIEEVDVTQRIRDVCMGDNRIQHHFLPREEGNPRKDRADHKLMTEVFLFAMKHRRTPLINLLAGDEDFVKTVKTLQGLGYVLSSGSCGSRGRKMVEACRQLEFQWDAFRNPGWHVVPALVLPTPEIGTPVSNVLQQLRVEPTPALPALTHGNAIGVFVDVNSIQVKGKEHNFLHHRLIGFAEHLERNLLTTQLYGHRRNMPSEEDHGTTHTPTTASKANNLVNTLMAGLGKFAVEEGPSSAIMVMSDNLNFETIISGFADVGFEMYLEQSHNGSCPWLVIRISLS